MIDFVAERVGLSCGAFAVSIAGISTSSDAVAPGARFNLGVALDVVFGETTWCMVVSSSPQSIDQLPSAIADEANSLTTNMLTTAKNSENMAYQSKRHGRWYTYA